MLYVAVFVEPGIEELADANWIDYIVVGHEDKSLVERSHLQKAITPFLDSFDWESQYDPEADEEAPVREFTAFMEGLGYTVFPPAKLEWAVG